MQNVTETKTSLLSLLRTSGTAPEDLGAAMLRLATLAAETHRSLQAEHDRTHGRVRGPKLPARSLEDLCGPEHTEVRR